MSHVFLQESKIVLVIRITLTHGVQQGRMVPGYVLDLVLQAVRESLHQGFKQNPVTRVEF